MLDEHYGYVTDSRRLERFRSAIVQKVGPGAVVVDLGCGSGILGLACLQAGASRLFAIDSTRMIDIARETFARAGFADRCVLIRDRSYAVELPMLADAVICDHVGYFGFDYGVVELLRDARKRFLKSNGVVLPARISLVLGLVQSAEARKKADEWRAAEAPPEYHWLGKYGVNAKHPVRLSGGEILGSPRELGTIDLMADNPDFFSWSAELVAKHDATLHGLAGWFECELVEGVWMTNSPMAEGAIDRPQAFLPISESVPVKAEERIVATVMARPSDNLIAWSVELPRSGRRFSHSTWEGFLSDAGDLMRANSQRMPHPSRAGRARSIVLRYCDGRRTAKQVEEIVLSDHPDLFPAPDEIARFVAEVLARDTD